MEQWPTDVGRVGLHVAAMATALVGPYMVRPVGWLRRLGPFVAIPWCRLERHYFLDEHDHQDDPDGGFRRAYNIQYVRPRDGHDYTADY